MKFFKNLRKNEDGNSFLMYIFLLPILCGFFGLGLDASLGMYTRNGIQNAADTAVLYGASQMAQSGNQQTIDQKAATAAIKKSYSQARTNYPNLNCGSSTCYKLTPKYSKDPRTGRHTIVTITIQEKSPTIFLHMFGQPKFTYNITSQARVTTTYEKK